MRQKTKHGAHKPGHLRMGGHFSEWKGRPPGFAGGSAIVGEAIELAAARGWDRRELARRALVSVGCLKGCIRVDRISPETLGSLAVALGVNRQRLLEVAE